MQLFPEGNNLIMHGFGSFPDPCSIDQICAIVSKNIAVYLVKGLSGETITFVAVTQLTFDPFVLNFCEVILTKSEIAKIC